MGKLENRIAAIERTAGGSPPPVLIAVTDGDPDPSLAQIDAAVADHGRKYPDARLRVIWWQGDRFAVP